MTEEYDSAPDTLAHIKTVQDRLEEVIADLRLRSIHHDHSKLEPPEKEMFDEYSPKLRASTYGSDEYKGFLKEMGAALAHHYEVNDHHPEHWTEDDRQGIGGMSLIALIEMLADWKAATERHDDGDLARSIESNQERFMYTDEVKGILINTAGDLGWL